VIDATVNRWFSFVFYTASDAGFWFDPITSGGTVPTSGFGIAVGAFRSPNAGIAWVTESYAAVDILAQKTACSPTSTQTPSQTQSQSPSSFETPTGTSSSSNTGTPSRTATESGSVTA